MNAAHCRYCQSSTECRGSAWTANGRDLERFERNHTADRREALKIARAMSNEHDLIDQRVAAWRKPGQTKTAKREAEKRALWTLQDHLRFHGISPRRWNPGYVGSDALHGVDALVVQHAALHEVAS